MSLVYWRIPGKQLGITNYATTSCTHGRGSLRIKNLAPLPFLSMDVRG